MIEKSDYELKLLAIIILGGLTVYLTLAYQRFSFYEKFIFLGLGACILLLGLASIWVCFSKTAKESYKRLEKIKELPVSLYQKDAASILLGHDLDLKTNIFLPDYIRSRHIHVIGATGSGKTESVILHFLKQDVAREFGAIILDAKGDATFLNALKTWVRSDNLKIFDLGDSKSFPYNPLSAGTPLESAQRLFSSFIWSETYYASKARSVLQILFQAHYARKGHNPTLKNLAKYLSTPEDYSGMAGAPGYPVKLALQDYMEISGLKDQINSLCSGHLADILSSESEEQIDLTKSSQGQVVYFRLQSLMSPQIVSTLGKLIVNNLSFIAGTAHRDGKSGRFTPVYLDEFASFACPEFADLISKARSAGFALHFSHQSIGDLVEVSKGFLNRITDNSATKIILRINDPDSAEFFAHSFGTRIYQKVTQKVINAKEIDAAEVQGDGTIREAHQFRASPDLFKGHPTGVGSVLVAHGSDTPHGASSVFKIKFPKLNEGENI